MRVTIAFSADSAMFDWLELAVSSFLHHNPALWGDVVIADVGLTPKQSERISSHAPVVAYARNESYGHIKVPNAMARWALMEDYCDDSSALFYIDADAIVCGSVCDIINRFLESGRAFAALPETDPRAGTMTIAASWKRYAPPPGLFPNFARYARRPDYNTGVFLARGRGAQTLAQECSRVYPLCERAVGWGDQTIFNTVIAEREIAVHALTADEHCYVAERFVSHVGDPYTSTSLIDGKPISIRHFAGWENKTAFRRSIYWQATRERYGL